VKELKIKNRSCRKMGKRRNKVRNHWPYKWSLELRGKNVEGTSKNGFYSEGKCNRIKRSIGGREEGGYKKNQIK
jgi:hypothetical protein